MDPNRYICLLCMGWLCLCFCSIAAAETYRWVDDKGRVHYADRPPDRQAETTVIEHHGIEQAEQRAKELYQAQESLWNRVEESEVRRFERAEERKQRLAEQARRRQQKEACASLRQNMDDLSNRRWRLYVENENGERGFLSAQERKTLYEELQQLAQQYNCP